MRIEKRKSLWKKRYYSTIVKENGIEILRPTEKSLDTLIEKALRRRKKWE